MKWYLQGTSGLMSRKAASLIVSGSFDKVMRKDEGQYRVVTLSKAPLQPGQREFYISYEEREWLR